MTKLTVADCELCKSASEMPIWQDDFCRVVLVDDPDYPGFCRVILQNHVKEMSDLPPAERSRLMDAVFATEAALRDLLAPDKINLASLGNAVPHLHWHVIPRWRDDRHFPKSVWAAPERDPVSRPGPNPQRLAALLKQTMKTCRISTSR